MIVNIDFETRSTVDLRKTGVYPYATHPTTGVWCMAYSVEGEEPRLWFPGDDCPEVFLWPGVVLRAWNANFERQIWNAIMVKRYGFPAFPLDRWYCTMAEALAMGLPGSLEKAAEALTVAEQKDKSGANLMLRMAKPRSVQPDGTVIWWDDPTRIKRLASYCQQDVRTEVAIFRRVQRLSRAERDVWLLDQTINDRGVGIDAALVAALRDIDNAAQADANRRMRELTGGAVTALTQAGALKEWLEAHGVWMEGVAKDDVREALEGTLDPVVEEVLLLRQEAGGTSSRKLSAMAASVSQGDRIRGMLAYHGASTGRWAGRLVQPQNLPRGTIKHKHLEPCLQMVLQRNAGALELLFGSIHSVVPSSLRACFKAAPGNVLYAGDYSQIEARVLPWLSGAEHVLDVFRAGRDIYQSTADAMGVDRQIGKVAVLALGFQGGKGAFKNMAKVYGLKVTDEQAEEFKVKWREANPEAVAMWDEVQRAALRAVKDRERAFSACGGKVVFFCEDPEWLTAALPSGRKLWYCRPHVVRKTTPWGREVDELRAWGVDSFTKKWESYSLYGGLLTENLVQAVARDIMAGAMLRLERGGYPVVLTVHDEVVCERRDGDGSLDEFLALMTTTPKWADGLPVKAEAWTGNRYRK